MAEYARRFQAEMVQHGWHYLGVVGDAGWRVPEVGATKAWQVNRNGTEALAGQGAMTRANWTMSVGDWCNSSTGTPDPHSA